ncbi:hypothetical protein [Paenibacillus piri]|uniref:hypothetical protein n=1 Tax=Paenibacillus piri TaxID=2547395 RepID=UPI001404E1EB|nr:hypothetical protein [Paenibacillus piri]
MEQKEKPTFEQQARQQYHDLKIKIPQWVSPAAAKPLAKLAVTPDDFPFLNQVKRS